VRQSGWTSTARVIWHLMDSYGNLSAGSLCGRGVPHRWASSCCHLEGPALLRPGGPLSLTQTGGGTKFHLAFADGYNRDLDMNRESLSDCEGQASRRICWRMAYVKSQIMLPAPLKIEICQDPRRPLGWGTPQSCRNGDCEDGRVQVLREAQLT
jgi:hypothetical protein